MPSPLLPSQIRGARGLLDWTMIDLALAAGVSVSTIKRLESGGERILTTRPGTAIRAALETAGVRFIEDGRGRVGVLHAVDRAGLRRRAARADPAPPTPRPAVARPDPGGVPSIHAH